MEGEQQPRKEETKLVALDMANGVTYIGEITNIAGETGFLHDITCLRNYVVVSTQDIIKGAGTRGYTSCLAEKHKGLDKNNDPAGIKLEERNRIASHNLTAFLEQK